MARRLPDTSDAEIRNAVEGYATEAEINERAKRSFDAWWGDLSYVDRCERDGLTAWQAFREGYFSLAREMGELPDGGRS